MNRVALSGVATIAMCAMAVGVAGRADAASGPRFVSAMASVDQKDRALIVDFHEENLGKDAIGIVLTADATATYQCEGGGQSHAQEDLKAEVSASGSFSPADDTIIDKMSVGPLPPGSFSCRDGQTLELTTVSYKNIVLTDTTNAVKVNVNSGVTDPGPGSAAMPR